MIVSVIGTRPQYIKVKPIHDAAASMGIEHRIWDTGQHYEASMTKDIATDLAVGIDEVLFPASLWSDPRGYGTILSRLTEKLLCHRPSMVLVYGDTTSSFLAACACRYAGIPYAHIEAGVRCGDLSVPEEVNRIFVDSASTLNFCTQRENMDGVHSAVLTGDLEYEYLSGLDLDISYDGPVVMTIHRGANVQKERIREVMDIVRDTPCEVVLPVHHRLRKALWWDALDKPDNLTVIDPVNYSTMIGMLARCRYVITDSGSIPKILPYFGKRFLSLRDSIGWQGMGPWMSTVSDRSQLEQTPQREPGFMLYGEPPSRIIFNTVCHG